MDQITRDSGTAFFDLLLASHTSLKKVAELADMSAEEVLCLYVLQEHHPENVKALSRHLGVRSSRMSKILFSLEERGFVIRSISIVDHRMEEVTLTPRGTDRMAKILAFGRSLAESHPFAGGHGLSASAPPPAGKGHWTHSRSLSQDQEHH
jgi:DNA-binding MarR family transcriptional regulator